MSSDGSRSSGITNCSTNDVRTTAIRLKLHDVIERAGLNRAGLDEA
ncbi:hypothetical protein ACVWXQ_004264 [Bradyrhizobium sp. S3.14.4]